MSTSMDAAMAMADPAMGIEFVEASCPDVGCSCTIKSIASDQMGELPSGSCDDDGGVGAHPSCKEDKVVHGINDVHLETAGHTYQHFSLDDTLFLFDWDDTILPSTWVAAQRLTLDNGSVLTDKQRKKLKEVSSCTTETLSLAKQVGTVVLVTNAERGWIELSSRKFLPEIVPLLESCKLISARTTHESPERPMPLDWKLEAFAREITSRTQSEDWNTKDVAAFTNVLSIGDGAHEREALIRVSASLPGCRGKSLRFIERPSINKLCRQHRLVSKRMRQLVRYDGDLDLCMRRGMKKRKVDKALPDKLDASQPVRPRLENGVQGVRAVLEPPSDQLGESQPDSARRLGVVQGLDVVQEPTHDQLDAIQRGLPPRLESVQGFDAVRGQLDASQMDLPPMRDGVQGFHGAGVT